MCRPSGNGAHPQNDHLGKWCLTHGFGGTVFSMFKKKYTYKYVHNQYPIISPSISNFRVVMFLCGLNSLRHGRRPQAHVLERKGHADAGCIVPVRWRKIHQICYFTLIPCVSPSMHTGVFVFVCMSLEGKVYVHKKGTGKKTW